MLDRGRQLGVDKLGLLDLLEFAIATRGDDRAKRIETARRFEGRRDVSPQVSLAARLVLLWDALEHKDFEQARQRAMQVLSVQDDPDAEMVMWAIAEHDKQPKKAVTHLAKAKLKPAIKTHRQIIGYLALDQKNTAENLLLQLRQMDNKLAEMAQQKMNEGVA
jgi:hypothetical protein